ncbi:MAG: TIGR02281 family clan AA aspartic protease [Lautropia sp.]
MSDDRGPPAGTLKIAALFVAVGAALFLAIDRFGPWQQGGGRSPKPIERLSEAGLDLERTRDGHFYLSGTIDGHRLVFMVDTGASTIAIGRQTAQAIGLGECAPRRYETAAGTVDGCQARAARVEVGGLRLHDVPVAVLPGADDAVLLGMNVLRHFRIEQSGGRMRLTPERGGDPPQR